MKRLLIFIFLLLLIGCRPTDMSLKNIESGIKKLATGQDLIREDIIFISKEIKVLIKNDSIMRIQLLHFPSTSPISLTEMTKVTSVYNERVNPITHEKEFHWGIDYAAKEGTPVLATADGVIEEVATEKGFGNVIRINHIFGYSSLYGHLEKIIVKQNQRIKQGDIIGLVGSTGQSTGPHLHYEMYYLKKRINPNIFQII